MSRVSLIVAVDERGGMGIEGRLPWHLPADLAYFKQTTIGKPVMMGRKTFVSIGRPLPKRLNIVLSRHVTHLEGVTVLPSLEAALLSTRHLPEVMVIGGAEIFRLALPIANCIYLTRVHAIFPADTYFPVFDASDWQETLLFKHAADAANAYDLSFYRYEK